MKTTFVLGGFAVFAAASFGQFWTQNPHTPGATGGNGLSGFQGNLTPSNYDREVGDDFTVTGGPLNVNRIVTNWVQFTDGDPNLITGMNIDFYNISGGVVGSLIASRAVGAPGISNGPGIYFGRTEKILDTSFANVALANGDYFVCVQPLVNHNWFWLTSTPTTPINLAPTQIRRGPNADAGIDATWPATWQQTGPNNPIFATAYDQAIKIYGSPVPEPATMAVLGLGALALIRRRKA